LIKAIEKFEKMHFSSKEIAKSSQQFTKQEFQSKIKAYIDKLINEA